MSYDKSKTQWWKDALEGKDVPIHLDTPMRGFYAYQPGKDKEIQPVAFWYGEDGKLHCTIKEHAVSYGLDVWTGCARHPVAYEVYLSVIKGDAWPNEVRAQMKDGSTQSSRVAEPKPGHNTGENPEEDAVLGNISEWIDRANSLLKGGPPKTKDDADKFADISTKLGELTKEADDLRTAESGPHYTLWKEINARWGRRIKPATDTVAKLKAAIGIFQREERARREDAAKKAQEEAGEGSGVKIEAEPVRVGTRRVVSNVKRDVVVLEVPLKAAEFFINQKPMPAQMIELIEKLAFNALKGGIAVPGAKLEKKESTR